MEKLVTSFMEATGLKSKYKMVLIGQTGSGKTSFLNLLCNYEKVQKLGMDNGLKQLRYFHNIKFENTSKYQMESKTSRVSMYDVYLGGLHVGIIDTPGFGDSRGIDVDKQHVAKIIEALKNEGYVNCICLIINGRESRINPTLKYVLSEVTAILPKTVINNVIVMFTNASGKLQLLFNVKILKEFFGREIQHSFCVENPYCLFEKANESSMPINEIAEELREGFEKAAKQLDKMLTAVYQFPQVHTNDFVRLYAKKQEIEEKIVIIVTEYNNQTVIEKEIATQEKKLTAASKTKQLNEKFEIRVPRKITEKTPSHNTLCAAPSCTSNCHESCTLEKTIHDKNVFKRCACMGGNDTCRVCGHSYQLHFHGEYVYRDRVEVISDPEMKKEFDRAKNDEEKAKIKKMQLDKRRGESEEKKEKLSGQLTLAIKEFQILGMSRSYLIILQTQLVLVEQYLEAEVNIRNAAQLQKTKQTLEQEIAILKSKNLM